MSFTDEDLKWLKEDLADRKDTKYETASRMTIEEAEALITRLEAAERWGASGHHDPCCIENGTYNKCTCDFGDAESAWRKAAGK